MVTWLVDHAVTCYLLLLCLGLALLAGWWMTRKRSYAIGLGAVAGLAGLVFLLTLWVDTDEKQIRRVLQEMSEGIKERNLDRTFGQLSDDFTMEFSRSGATVPMSKAEVRALADRANRNGGVSEIVFRDFDFEKVEPPRATVYFTAKPFGRWATGAEYCGCRAQFRQEQGRWHMTHVKLFKPQSTESLDLAVPSG